MEKWRDEIEEMLSHNRTIDRWIIRDFVWQEDNSIQRTMLAMSHLMTAMKLMCTGPDAISEPELKERIKKSLAETGLPGEAINCFFALLERQTPLEPDDRPEEATDEETNEPLGDDE